LDIGKEGSNDFPLAISRPARFHRCLLGPNALG
jgi:hypothetical protein